MAEIGNRTFARLSAVCLCLLVVCVAMPRSGLGQAAQAHIVLGRITQEPQRNLERLTPMADYLARRLKGTGIASVEIRIAATPETMAEMLRNGTVDLFSETPFIALELIDKGLAEPLAREWKGGVPEYHSVIIAREGGPVRSLSDLRGRRFAFEDAGSTSGYLIPRDLLEESGLSLFALADPRAPVPDDQVGYSFAKGEINVVAWVNRGLADAGALSNLDWQDEKRAPAALRKGLRVVHESTAVIRSLILVRSGLDAGIKQAIRDVLFDMHNDPEGRDVLRRYFKVSRYDELNDATSQGLIAANAIRKRVNNRPPE